MSATTRWQTYAECWSSAQTRAAVLAEHVDETVAYCDPGVVLDGREALAGYMRGFEEAFPGGRFAIDAVYTHHERSLARWRQLSADGDAVRSGISFAVHATDGRFLAVTGFFLDQPHAEEPL